MKTFLFSLKTHALGLILLFFAGFFSQQGFGQTTILSQGFESSFPPTGWANLNSTSNKWGALSQGSAHTGSGAAEYISASGAGSANAFLITPALSLTGGVTYTISYWERTNNSYYEKLKITVGTSQTIAAQTTTVQDLGRFRNSAYTQQTTTFTPGSSGTYYFAWNCYSANNSTDGDYLDVDDILITYPGANLNVSSTSLAFGNQVSGTTSVASQNFNLSGANLTGFPGTITVTAPSTDFQVSNNNSSWGSSTTIAYSSATLSATPVYVRFAPQSTGAKSGNITFSGGGAGSTPTVAVSGTGTASQTSDVITDNSYTYTSNVAYGSYQTASGLTSANTVGAMGLILRDGGASSPDADNLPTALTNIVFSTNSSTAIRSAAIFQAGTKLQEVAVNGATSFSFSGLSLSAADNSTQGFELRVTYQSAVADNQQIQFTVSSVTANASGSSLFFAANGGAAASLNTGSYNKIAVIATKLSFVQQTSNSIVGVAMSPSVTIAAVDANNNTDIDYTTAVSVSSTGTFAGTATTSATPASGVATFGNLVFSATGSGLTLAGTSGSLTATGNSSAFNVTTSQASKVIANSGYTYTGPVAYINYQSASGFTTGNSVGAMGLILQDGGGSSDADNLPTTLTNITFSTGGSTAIRTAALFAGGVEVSSEVPVNGATSISFSGLSIVAADNSNTNFELRVTYQSTVTDQQQVQFTVTSVTANTTGSGFAAADGSGAVSSTSGSNNKIQVTATKLIFIQQPSNVLSGSAMSPSVTVKESDANGNTDIHDNTSVTLSTTATFAGTATTTVTPVSGIATFSNLVFSGAGSGFTLAGTSGSLTATGNSSTFNVTASQVSKVIVTSGYSYTSNVAYINYQSATSFTTANSVGAMGLTLQDGGGSPDGDNLPTTLTNITFSTGSSTAIRTAALFAGGVEISSEVAVNGATSISFSGLSIVAADNSNTNFELRVTYQSTVTDQQQVQFTVTSVTANATGSAFVSANGSGAVSSTSGSNNKIQVTATKLVFSQQPSDVAQGDQMSPAVTVKEIDALGNLDTHDNTAVILSSTGTFTGNATKTVTPVSGIATFSNLIFNTTGSSFTIAGTSGSLTATGNSNTFNVTAFVSRSTDYFKSFASADWAFASTWTGSHDNVNFYIPTLYPTSAANAIAIQNGHAIAVNSSVSGAGITVPTGAAININSGATLAIANGSGTDLSITGSGIVTVNSGGTLSNSGTISSSSSTLIVANGGTYQHTQNGGAIPPASWGLSSTCNITGITTTPPSGLSAAFGNVIWNCTGQVFVDDGFGVGVDQGVSIGNVTTNGSFNLKSTGSSFIDISILTVKGSYIQTGGTLVDFANANSGNTTATLNVAGDFNISGGILSANAAINNATLNIVFNGTTTQHFIKTGGTITTTNQLFANTLTNSFTINNGAIVDFSTYVLNGTGNFTLSSGGTIITANTNGFGNSGSVQLSGSKSFSGAANYTFSGSGTQNTGTNFPATLTGSLTIANTNATTGVTITNTAQTINGALNIAAGSILTLPTATSTTTLGGTINNNNTGIINAGTSSTLVINGSGTISNPLVFGTGTFSVFTLNRTGSVITLGSALNTAALNLTNGKIDASAYVLTVTTTPVIGGFSSANYIITGNGSGSGYLQINNLAVNTQYTFPVGTSSYYLPANVKPVTTGGLNWTAKVFTPATTNGAYSGPAYSGSALQSIVNSVWDIAPTPDVPTTATITLNWVDAIEGSVFSGYVDSYIGISHYTSGAWQGGTATGGASNSSDYVTSTFTSFSPFGVGAVSNPLPVVLVGFDAALNNNKTVDVSWTTEQEVNSSHFEIERSADGTHWQTIGSVQAKGNSALPSNYGYTDETPLDGINYYRLKMVNIAGDFGYTTIRIIRTMQAKGINIFPNPARNYVNISVSQTATELNIRLINQSGQVLQAAKINAGGSTTISLQVQNYPQGTYLLQISGADGTQQTSKVVIMR